MTKRTITAAAVALLAAITACGQGPVPARVVRIDSGVADTGSVYAFPYSWAGQVPGGHPAAWMCPEGFLFGANSHNAALPYLMSDGEHLSASFTGWAAWLSGHVVSLDLDEDSAVSWLERASETDLARLRLVSVPDSLPSTLRPAIERLATANPSVGLFFDSQAEMDVILPRFRPRTLWLDNSARLTSGHAAVQRQIESLSMSAESSGSLAVLRELPKLRHLLLDEWDTQQPGQLPADLEALTAFNSTVDMSRLGDLPRLRLLILSGSEWHGAADLAALKKLRWLGLPSNATQVEFAAIVRTHPDLEVLDLVFADSVIDLSPLRGAHRLRALTLGGQFRNFDVLRELNSLKFVGLSNDIWEDSPDQVAAIRAALPGAVVVKVTPLCLGSGWILLLIPAALFVMLAGRRTRRA